MAFHVCQAQALKPPEKVENSGSLAAQLVFQAGAGACEGELPHFLMRLREA